MLTRAELLYVGQWTNDRLKHLSRRGIELFPEFELQQASGYKRYSSMQALCMALTNNLCRQHIPFMQSYALIVFNRWDLQRYFDAGAFNEEACDIAMAWAFIEKRVQNHVAPRAEMLNWIDENLALTHVTNSSVVSVAIGPALNLVRARAMEKDVDLDFSAQTISEIQPH